MSTTSIRWTVAKQLVDLLSAHEDLTGCQVEPGWPGDQIKAESIWVESLAGDETFPVMLGNVRQITDDIFDVVLAFKVANRSTLDATGDRLFEMVGALEDIVKNDPTLGLQSIGVLEVQKLRIDPRLGRFPEGVLGGATVTMSVYVRLH